MTESSRFGHVVVAPDKFKGSLTAAQVAAAIASGLRAVLPALTIRMLPVADGGDGTLEAAVAAGFSRVQVTVSGPTGAPIAAAIGVKDDIAVVELALASGLALVPHDRLEPLEANSYGTGELVRAALDYGCATVVLAVGGSASTDGGAGMLSALGVRFLDSDGADLPLGGGALERLHRVDRSGLDPRLATTRLVVATDVDNPLLGAHGAARVYGKQKGASADDIELLERGLGRMAAMIDPAGAEARGAGAAGGVGYAALSVLSASARSGIDVVLDLLDFHHALDGARLVITGEGRLDEQTLHGKAPAGVASTALRAGVPVVAVCGARDLDDERLHAAGFTAAYALTDVEPDIARCIHAPVPLLQRVGRLVAQEQLLP